MTDPAPPPTPPRGDLPPVALIGGASGEIGRAVAAGAAARGWAVGLWGNRNRDRVTSLAAELTDRHGVATVAVTADLADRDATDAAAAEVVDRLGPPGLVLAAAGTRSDGLLWAQDPDRWTEIVQVNLIGTFHLLRAVAPAMVRQRAGRIVAVVSPAGLHGNRGQSAYAASKAGVVAMVRSLAAEVGRRSVTVNAVAPGFVASEITDDVPDDVVAGLLASTALQRPVTAEEVAAAVWAVADNAAVTGQVLSVDGGLGGLTT